MRWRPRDFKRRKTEDVGYFTGIVRLGRFDDVAGAINALIGQTGDFAATIELAN